MIVVVSVVVGLVIGLWLPAAFAVAARRAGRPGGAKDRRHLVNAAADAVAGLILGYVLIPWHDVPALLWAVPVAITAYGAIESARVWRQLPWVSKGRPALAWTGSAVNVGIAAGLVALVLA